MFVPYSPLNINDIYARGGTLNDAWADGFFAGSGHLHEERRDNRDA